MPGLEGTLPLHLRGEGVKRGRTVPCSDLNAINELIALKSKHNPLFCIEGLFKINN